MDSRVTVVGIGADGWPGLAPRSRELITSAAVVVGSSRHLELLPAPGGQARVPLPSPLRPALRPLLEEYAARGSVVVLASGDPLVSGIASTLLDLGVSVAVEPAVSSVALARARMGWPAETVAVLSLVGRPVARLARLLAPGRRVLVLSSDGSTPVAVAGLLVGAGYGDSRLTVLSDLGTGSEGRVDTTAAEWSGVAPPLNVVAISMAGPVVGSLTGGLPDDAFVHDGQLTRRDVRACALARLAPQPGELLWDVGAGAGSVGIEWSRADASCRAVAVEADPERASRISGNAERLGVPDLQVVHGRAPDALVGLPRPDAVFVGGGATRDGVIDTCLAALQPGGRLVVHGVTLETEALLARLHAAHGGELTRISVETVAPIGTFRGWTPARAVTQWSLVRG